MPFRPTQADLDRYESHFQEVMARWRYDHGLEKAYPVNPDLSKPAIPYTPPKSYRYPIGYNPVDPTPWTHEACPYQHEEPRGNEGPGTNLVIDPDTGEVIGRRVGDAIRI